jgi:hypothetical protein
MQTIEPNVEWHLEAAQNRGLDVIEGDLEAGDGMGAHAATLRRSLSLAQFRGKKLAEPVDAVIVDPLIRANTSACQTFLVTSVSLLGAPLAVWAAPLRPGYRKRLGREKSPKGTTPSPSGPIGHMGPPRSIGSRGVRWGGLAQSLTTKPWPLGPLGQVGDGEVDWAARAPKGQRGGGNRTQYSHFEISDNFFSSRLRSSMCIDCSSSN